MYGFYRAHRDDLEGMLQPFMSWSYAASTFEYQQFIWKNLDSNFGIDDFQSGKPTFADDYAGDISTTGVVIVDGAATIGNIDFQNDIDWFRFEITNPDTIVRFFAESANGDVVFNTVLRLFDADGDLLDIGAHYLGQPSVTIAHQFASAGTYFVSFDSTNSSGTYSISATQQFDDFGQDINTQGVLQIDGATIVGEFQYFFDKDWFAFDITNVADIIRFTSTQIDIHQLNTGTGAPIFKIYDSNGALVIAAPFTGTNPNMFDYGFVTTGRYYLELSDAFKFLMGYELAAEVIDHDDLLANSNTNGILTIDGGMSSGSIQYVDDLDWFALEITNPDEFVHFDLINFNLNIYSASGALVKSFVHDPGNGFNYSLDHVFETAGTYYIEVQNGFAGLENYEIEASSLPNDMLFLTSGNDDFTGTAIDDHIDGESGNDQIFGGNGDDLLFGGLGDDLLDGGDGRDSLFGGDGDDVLIGFDGWDTLDGGDGNDVLNGGGFSDNLFGGNGDDSLEGGEQSDIINGGNGIDTAIYRGQEAVYSFQINQFSLYLNSDYVNQNPNDLTFLSFSGADTLIDIEIIDFGGTIIRIVDQNNSVFSNDIDLFFGNDQGNTIHAAGGADELYGQLGDDTLFGDAGDDHIFGGMGADILHGGADNDVLVGDDGADNVLDGDDTLYGDAGRDLLVGGAGADNLFGGADDDRLEGGLGADSLDGGEGSDTAIYVNSSRSITVDLRNGQVSGGEANGDTLISIENIDGTSFNDTIIGNEYDNVIKGGAGADFMDGGEGSDTLDYSDAGFFVIFIDLEAGTAANGTAEGDVFVNFENIIGGQQGDHLSGDSNSNIFTGAQGLDIIDGRGGVDFSAYSGNSTSYTIVENFDGSVQISENEFGTNFYDTLTNIEFARFADGDVALGTTHMVLTEENDTYSGNSNDNDIDGGAGNDTLSGNEGADKLDGGLGNDFLDGGTGDDMLTGGAGADVFIMAVGNGHDTITDFEIGVDRIEFADGFYRYEQLSVFQSGSDVIIKTASGTITLIGVDVADLTISDFSFRLESALPPSPSSDAEVSNKPVISERPDDFTFIDKPIIADGFYIDTSFGDFEHAHMFTALLTHVRVHGESNLYYEYGQEIGYDSEYDGFSYFAEF